MTGGKNVYLISFISAQELPDILVPFWIPAADAKFEMHLKMCFFPNSLNSVR